MPRLRPSERTTAKSQARAEPSRLALVIGKIPFEDDRIALADWPARRQTIPLQAVPMLEVDGKRLSQANAIVRYTGHLAGMYPSDDPWKAALVDEVMETVADVGLACAPAARFAGPAGPEKTAAGEKAVASAFPRYLGGLEARIDELGFGGPFVLGEQVSLADIAITVSFNLFVVLHYFDGVTPEDFEPYTKLKEIRDAVMAIPEVEEWYKKHPLEN